MKLSAEEGELAQRKVNLDAHEEELAVREEKLGGALKQAEDAAVVAEAAKKELETKVAQLEADLKASGEELVALKREREKDAHSNSELQVRLAEKGKELSTAKDSNADLELKLTTLTKTLDGAREQEVGLKEEIKADKARLASAAAAQNAFRENVEHWTESLVSAATDIDRELAQLGVGDLGYPSDENLQPSAKLTLFFKGVATALQRLRENIPKQLADESLQKVLVKVAFRNPGLNLTNVLRTLPPDADLEALKTLVAPIVDKVSGIKRIEGDRVD